MNKPNVKYKFYATLLDGYQDYLGSSEIYQEYWGFSENPSKTEDEFEAEQLQGLINRINRVPFDSEAADKGTAFNEVVDCLVLNQKTAREDMSIVSDKEKGIILVTFKEREFKFPLALCREFANYYKGAVPQVYTEAVLSTRYGDVLLYGYIDELMPTCVHDIKTTSKYSVGKFLHHWQHVVYPFALQQEGNEISDFEYNIAVMAKYGEPKTYTEAYSFVPGRDIPRLQAHCEGLIEFIEMKRDLITDKKIFALDE